MADTKISGLPVGAAIAGTELLVAVQSGANVQTTPAALLTYVNANASLAAARITSGTLVPSRGGTGISNADANTLTLGGATSITGGGTLALGGFTLTVPATGSAALLAVANVFTAAQTGQRDGIGAVSTDGLILTNATAAAAGAQQQSPRLRLTGQGWKTNATAASQTIDWAIEAVPVQGAANPTSQLLFRTQINAGGYSAAGYFASDLSLTLNGVLNATSTVNITGVTNLLTNSIRIVQTDDMYQFGNGSGVYDTALKRNAAGVVEVNNGTAGQWGSLLAGVRDAGTTTITDGLTLGHQSTGTPDVGLGTAIQLNINSSTTADQNAVRLTAEWVVATHASRTARCKLNVYDTAAREALRLEASGTAAMIGFLGASAAARQTSAANLTNNVTSGGTDDTIANYTDLTVYANDSAAIRNNIYQLARKLKQVNDALRLYGLLT